ncbi:MAG: hypothetical protein BWK80_26540 [Desulfobacteraceae bacterium IS3]|nr:MAG: hypothetical protein BWK80_26540 [Desulfobacteraceae bacterium IS3]
MDGDRIRLIECNRREYAEKYDSLKWLSENEARNASELRKEILSYLETRARFGSKHSKSDCSKLSHGCEICGQGDWSCLFINGKCNCRCFYCPAEQNEIDLPATNGLKFAKPNDYIDYIDKFGFRGVSISGGEPLLTFDKTLTFVSAVKRKFGDKIYLWLYTNGTLARKDMLSKLRDAGLDEIRFDIGATHYNLKKAETAVGVIKNVTVEIPAVPEDYEQMKLKLSEMRDIGINYLNLHQLRLTPHNYRNIAKRNYTFLHGEKVTVLESELTALNLLKYSLENNIGLPVNYCSFVYKNRFQNAASRRRNADFIKKSFEDITENGYIRSLCLTGKTEDIVRQADDLRKRGFKQKLWSLNSSENRLFFSESLWKSMSLNNVKLSVGYAEAKILPAVSYRNLFREINLNKTRKVVIEKMKAGDEINIAENEISLFEHLVLNKEAVRQGDEKWDSIQNFEFIREGFQEYF